jgi:hypothetical protein
MPRNSPFKVAAALDYLERLKSQAAEFGGGVAGNLADRARSVGGLAYEALTSDPNMGRMTTAEFSQAADRPTPRLDQAAQDLGTIGKAIVTQPIQTGKALVQGEIERAQGAFDSPRAAGEYAGSMVDPMRLAAALRKTAPVLEMDVYHGTPHRFDPTEENPLGEFDASRIGTGEGAQSYGHGIYFAEHPKVAKKYKMAGVRTRQNPIMSINDIQVMPNTIDYHAASLVDGMGLKEAKKYIEKAIQDPTVGSYYKDMKNIVDKIKLNSNVKNLGYGSLYTADLPDEKIAKMLDFDKPLTKQPKNVKLALAKLGEPQEKLDAYDDALLKALFEDAADPGSAPRNPSGADIVYKLENKLGKKGASDYLRGLGIPGIRYLDANSRDRGRGTRNFVVFPGEEKNVKILKRD